MTIIAMTREMGSLGKFVAEGLAADLHLNLLYHEVIDSVSEKMHLPGSVVTRFLQGRAMPIERFRTDMDALSLYTAEEVLNIAAHGNLMIRGWGATCLLRPVSHVVCVRVCAPMEARIRHIMERLGIDDPDLAQAEIKRNDAAHSAAMQRRFGINWEDPAHYDLVLNTERLSVTACIEQIKALAKQPDFQETTESHAKLLNLALSAHIQAELRNDPVTHDVKITIDTFNDERPGNLILRGIVLSDDEKRMVEDLSSRCPGVSAVENQLRVMTGSRIRRTLNG